MGSSPMSGMPLENQVMLEVVYQGVLGLLLTFAAGAA